MRDPTTPAAGALAGSAAMVFVGGSVAVSSLLQHAPLLTAQAVRYALACLLPVVLARVARQPLVRPRGAEWAWLAGVAVTGLVVVNLALVRGTAHAEPAVLRGVALGLGPARRASSRPGARGGRKGA